MATSYNIVRSEELHEELVIFVDVKLCSVCCAIELGSMCFLVLIEKFILLNIDYFWINHKNPLNLSVKFPVNSLFLAKLSVKLGLSHILENHTGDDNLQIRREYYRASQCFT